MGQWQNFKIWRGKLPHWRADDVRYYVTFRHRRDLTPEECHILFRNLMKPDGKQWDLEILCVLPNQSEMIVTVGEKAEGVLHELSDIVEKAKTKAGKQIIKKTEERFPPFYQESYDRIMRDESEFETFWEAILESPVGSELVEDPEDYPCLWVPDSPNAV